MEEGRGKGRTGRGGEKVRWKITLASKSLFFFNNFVYTLPPFGRVTSPLPLMSVGRIGWLVCHNFINRLSEP